MTLTPDLTEEMTQMAFCSGEEHLCKTIFKSIDTGVDVVSQTGSNFILG